MRLRVDQLNRKHKLNPQKIGRDGVENDAGNLARNHSRNRAENIVRNCAENMTKMIDLANQMSGSQQTTSQGDYPNIDTNFSRVYGLLETKFKFGSFTSSDVMEAYEQQFDCKTGLSTISTYLSRLTRRGLLNRNRDGLGWTYRFVRQPIPTIPPNEQNNNSTIPNLLTQ